MAEAVVEERTSPPTRFYCHMCNLEINIFNNDYTCPLCSGGFIEELPPAISSSESGTSSSGPSSSRVGGSHVSFERESDSPRHRINDLFTTLLMSRNSLGPMLNNLEGPQELEISIDAAGAGGVGVSGSATPAASASAGSGETSSGNSVGRNSGGRRGFVGAGGSTRRQPNFHRLDNVFLEFLSSLSGGEDGVFGNSQMFFMGNPGDYAWGREGIDTVVTQLLNHMDTSGPPPLPKEKIAEIPTVEISETEVEQKLKCSVCWEDFNLQESVRKLPCLHVYHENCIVPWLDLHGTCPICRKSLQIEPSTSCSMHNGAISNPGQSDMSSPTATVAVTVTTTQPGTHTIIGRNNTNINSDSQTEPMDTSSPSVPPPPPPRRSHHTTQGTTSAPGTSSQSTNALAYEDGNVEYDFD